MDKVWFYGSATRGLMNGSRIQGYLDGVELWPEDQPVLIADWSQSNMAPGTNFTVPLSEPLAPGLYEIIFRSYVKGNPGETVSAEQTRLQIGPTQIANSTLYLYGRGNAGAYVDNLQPVVGMNTGSCNGLITLVILDNGSYSWHTNYVSETQYQLANGYNNTTNGNIIGREQFTGTVNSTYSGNMHIYSLQVWKGYAPRTLEGHYAGTGTLSITVDNPVPTAFREIITAGQSSTSATNFNWGGNTITGGRRRRFGQTNTNAWDHNGALTDIYAHPTGAQEQQIMSYRRGVFSSWSPWIYQDANTFQDNTFYQGWGMMTNTTTPANQTTFGIAQASGNGMFRTASIYRVGSTV